ncbi:MAG: PEP-CTERM sorting domain-containing protein, partial [Planctomycetota bacterium]
GFWNVGWAFPSDLVVSGSVASLAANFVGTGNNYFRTIGQNSNLNANILGFGLGQGVFQYTASGITGNQVGAVIPVAVPEPATIVVAGMSVAAAGIMRLRRRKLDRENA